jgi:predicted acylesterase/phospholipase RssA
MVLKNLVISGGGINGIGFIGIIRFLSENNLLKDINHYVGTSAGSIIGYLLSIGYNHMEIFEFCKHFNFSKIVNVDLDNFLEKYGFADSSKLYYILKRLTEAKKLNHNITFREHFEITNKKLTIVGTCLNDYKSHFFNFEKTPDMEILNAIRISSSIPLIFMPTVYENKLWLDGGMTENYPISLCDDEIENTLGICVNDECLENCNIESPKDLPEYLTQIFKCFIFSESLKNIIKYEKNTIKYSYSMGIFSDFQIDKQTIENMIQSGYDQAKKQKNIIEKFIMDEKINSETLSQTESDLIHKIISDVENDNLSENTDSFDSKCD